MLYYCTVVKTIGVNVFHPSVNSSTSANGGGRQRHLLTTIMNNILRSSLRAALNSRARLPQQTFSRRQFGAGQPESQSMQARLWEGHSVKPEGWEGTVYVTYAAATLIITLALGFAPDTTINTWAANEARVRLDLIKEGKIEKAEFGVHYNVPEKVFDFDSNSADNPFNEEDDDDDDDEEEDDEEDEEEADE